MTTLLLTTSDGNITLPNVDPATSVASLYEQLEDQGHGDRGLVFEGRLLEADATRLSELGSYMFLLDGDSADYLEVARTDFLAQALQDFGVEFVDLDHPKVVYRRLKETLEDSSLWSEQEIRDLIISCSRRAGLVGALRSGDSERSYRSGVTPPSRSPTSSPSSSTVAIRSSSPRSRSPVRIRSASPQGTRSISPQRSRGVMVPTLGGREIPVAVTAGERTVGELERSLARSGYSYSLRDLEGKELPARTPLSSVDLGALTAVAKAPDMSPMSREKRGHVLSGEIDYNRGLIQEYQTQLKELKAEMGEMEGETGVAWEQLDMTRQNLEDLIRELAARNKQLAGDLRRST